jgi:hypothetical protein
MYSVTGTKNAYLATLTSFPLVFIEAAFALVPLIGVFLIMMLYSSDHAVRRSWLHHLLLIFQVVTPLPP